MSYREVMHLEYQHLTNQIGMQFIIKPTNASASRSAFKVESYEDFEAIKLKLAR